MRQALSRVALILVAIAIAATPAHLQNAETRSPFDTLHFRDIGPAATGGRIHDLQIDPKNPAVLTPAPRPADSGNPRTRASRGPTSLRSSPTTRSGRSRLSRATRRSSGPARAKTTTARARRGVAASID